MVIKGGGQKRTENDSFRHFLPEKSNYLRKSLSGGGGGNKWISRVFWGKIGKVPPSPPTIRDIRVVLRKRLIL